MAGVCTAKIKDSENIVCLRLQQWFSALAMHENHLGSYKSLMRSPDPRTSNSESLRVVSRAPVTFS